MGCPSFQCWCLASVYAGVALCVGLTLLGQHVGRPWLSWTGKPLASAGFLAAAWYQGATATPYGRVVLLGLVLCAIGDLLLLSRRPGPAFLAGLFAFLCGHAGYSVAFWRRGIAWIWLGAAAVPACGAAALTVRWLWPHLQRRMRGPVLAYVVTISVMVATAGGTVGASGGWPILAGAIGFLLSDLSVARERFVVSSIRNRLWGLPLYYAAQLTLAASVRVPAAFP